MKPFFLHLHSVPQDNLVRRSRSQPTPGRRLRRTGIFNTGGTGLVLAIAKWIVDRHGGWFRVLSREEIGTRITVCLPKKAPGQDGTESAAIGRKTQ